MICLYTVAPVDYSYWSKMSPLDPWQTALTAQEPGARSKRPRFWGNASLYCCWKDRVFLFIVFFRCVATFPRSIYVLVRNRNIMQLNYHDWRWTHIKRVTSSPKNTYRGFHTCTWYHAWYVCIDFFFLQGVRGQMSKHQYVYMILRTRYHIVCFPPYLPLVMFVSCAVIVLPISLCPLLASSLSVRSFLFVFSSHRLCLLALPFTLLRTVTPVHLYNIFTPSLGEQKPEHFDWCKLDVGVSAWWLVIFCFCFSAYSLARGARNRRGRRWMAATRCSGEAYLPMLP